MKKTLSQFSIKILSVLSAIILWFIVITVENTIYALPEKVEVEVINLEETMSMENTIPDVKLYLRVDKDELKTLTKNDFDVFIDLKEVNPGAQTIKIEASAKNPEIKILKIEPEEVSLQISPTIEKEVKVEIIVQGEPAPGYIVRETTVEDGAITISGAKSIVDNIETITADFILEGTEKSDLNQNVMLSFDKAMDIQEGSVKLVPEKTIVSAIIESKLKTKNITVIPKFTDENEASAWNNKINISPETINILGEEEALKDIWSTEVKIFEISKLVRNEPIEVTPVLPEGISLVNENEKITVTAINKESTPTI